MHPVIAAGVPPLVAVRVQVFWRVGVREASWLALYPHGAGWEYEGRGTGLTSSGCGANWRACVGVCSFGSGARLWDLAHGWRWAEERARPSSSELSRMLPIALST